MDSDTKRDRDPWFLAAGLVSLHREGAIAYAVSKVASLVAEDDIDGALIWSQILFAVSELLKQPMPDQPLH